MGLQKLTEYKMPYAELKCPLDVKDSSQNSLAQRVFAILMHL